MANVWASRPSSAQAARARAAALSKRPATSSSRSSPGKPSGDAPAAIALNQSHTRSLAPPQVRSRTAATIAMVGGVVSRDAGT
jgi:hypothetical protein